MAGQVRYLKVKGGRFYARIAVPKVVQAVLGKTSLITPIGSDRREAMRRLPGAVAQFQRQIAAAKQEIDTGDLPVLIDRLTLTAAMKQHYRAELAADDAERPLSPEVRTFMELSRSIYAERLRKAVAGQLDGEELEALTGYAADALSAAGNAPAVTRDRLLTALAEVQLDALAAMEGRDAGKVRTVEPQSPLLTQPEPGNDQPPVPILPLFRAYIASRQTLGKHKDGARAWENAIADLVAFVGHTDARRITKRNLIDWRDHVLQSGKSPKTVSNVHLAAVRALFRWAHENDRLPTNEAEGVRQEVPKVQRSRERGYTDKEALVVLKAAVAYQPAETDNPANRESAAITAAKRWLPVLGAFTGARPAELAQLRKQDVRQEDGRWIIRITPDAGSVKAGGYRDVPLHRQIVALGFPAFVAASKDGPLFHNGKRPERYLASAQGTAGRLSVWLQAQSLVPEGVQPSHGWRHRFKTVTREIGVDPRIADAIQGHAARTAGENYGDVSLKAKLRVIDQLPEYELT